MCLLLLTVSQSVCFSTSITRRCSIETAEQSGYSFGILPSGKYREIQASSAIKVGYFPLELGSKLES